MSTCNQLHVFIFLLGGGGVGEEGYFFMQSTCMSFIQVNQAISSVCIIQILDTPPPPDSRAAPEDLIRSTKQVTLATAKAVGAGNSCRQEDVIQASNVSRQAIFDMLDTCRVMNPLLDSFIHKVIISVICTPAVQYTICFAPYFVLIFTKRGTFHQKIIHSSWNWACIKYPYKSVHTPYKNVFIFHCNSNCCYHIANNAVIL